MIDEDREIFDIIDRLAARYPDVPSSSVAEAVAAERNSFAQATVRDFVAVLIERHVRARLEKAV